MDHVTLDSVVVPDSLSEEPNRMISRDIHTSAARAVGERDLRYWVERFTGCEVETDNVTIRRLVLVPPR